MKNLFIKLLIGLPFIGATFASTVDVFSQSHVYKYYGVKDGLPSSEVYSAFQDSKGYMWFATDAGVSRFNGYEFENFDVSDGLTDNTVFLITEDTKERIWFGTFNCQLSYYDYKTDSIYSYKHNDKLSKDFLKKSAMTSFHVNSNETISIGFVDEGLYKIDKNGKGNFINSGKADVLDMRISTVNNEAIWGLQVGDEVIKKSFKVDFLKMKYFWEVISDKGKVESGEFIRDLNFFALKNNRSNFYIVNHNNQILVFLDNEVV